MNDKSLKNKTTTAPKKTVKKTATRKATAKKTVARKTVASKPRATTKKTAPASAKRKKTVKTAPAKMPITTIIAKIDVGYGNQLFIRGNGANLNWDHGIAMDNVTRNEWSLSSSEIRDDIECKLLINDRVWSAGENLTLKAGKKLVVEPKFS